MTTRLYELAYAYQQLRDNEELSPDDIKLALTNLDALFDEKVISIAHWVLDIDGDLAAVDSELKRLDGRKKAVKGRIDSLKAYLAQEMERAGKDKVKDATVSVTLRNNPASVGIINELEVPESYCKYTREIDKAMILASWKHTQATCAGVEIITNRKHVVIQ